MSIRALKSPVYPRHIRPAIVILVWILPGVGGLLVMLATEKSEPITKVTLTGRSTSVRSSIKSLVKNMFIIEKQISKKDEWYEILTVQIHKYTPIRTVAFIFIAFSWVLALSLGKAIGTNNASIAVALKYGLLPYFTLLIAILFLCIITYRKLNSKIQDHYSSAEIKQFLIDEDAVINLNTLNLFSAGGFSILAPSYANNKYQKDASIKSQNNESLAKLFLIFFLIIFHWWYVYMSPRGVAEIVYEIKFHGFFSSIKRAFLITYPWLILTYIIVICSSSYYGAIAIDLTK